MFDHWNVIVKHFLINHISNHIYRLPFMNLLSDNINIHETVHHISSPYVIPAIESIDNSPWLPLNVTHINYTTHRVPSLYQTKSYSASTGLQHWSRLDGLPLVKPSTCSALFYRFKCVGTQKVRAGMCLPVSGHFDRCVGVRVNKWPWQPLPIQSANLPPQHGPILSNIVHVWLEPDIPATAVYVHNKHNNWMLVALSTNIQSLIWCRLSWLYL